MNEDFLLYSDNILSVSVPSDVPAGESNFQTISDSPKEAMAIESESPSEETTEELVSSEETSQAYGSGREVDSQTMETSQEVGSSGTETQVDSQLLTSINTNLNNIYGLIIVSLVLVGCGLVLKFIWGLLNK